jgi:hypothetical protein
MHLSGSSNRYIKSKQPHYASVAAAELQQDQDSIAMSDIAATPPAAPPRPTHADLFIAFLRITLSSIGGALPWTRPKLSAVGRIIDRLAHLRC